MLTKQVRDVREFWVTTHWLEQMVTSELDENPFPVMVNCKPPPILPLL